MENEPSESTDGAPASLPVELTTAESISRGDANLDASAADNSVAASSASIPALPKSTPTKAKKLATATAIAPPPLGVRNTASATQRAPSISSRPSDRLASLARSTTSSTARKVSASAPPPPGSIRQSQTAYHVSSRLLAPTEASKAHTAAPRLAEKPITTATTRSKPPASAPAPLATVRHPYRPGQRPSTEPTPISSSLRSSSNKGTKPVVHAPRQEKEARIHSEPKVSPRIKAVVKATETRARNRVAAAAFAKPASGKEAAAVETTIKDNDNIQADKNILTLSTDSNAKISIVQQQADTIAGFEEKCSEYEQKVAQLEKELAVATEKHNTAIAKFEMELMNIKQTNAIEMENLQSQLAADKIKYDDEVASLSTKLAANEAQVKTNATELENLQSQLAADKKQHDDEIASLSTKLAGTEAQVNLRERELEGNSKVIKSLQEELKTTVETMQETAKTELEMLTKSYDGWRDKDYVDRLEKELETLKISAGYDTEVLSLKNTISNLASKNAGQSDLIIALETKLEVLTATIKSQGEENANLSAGNEALSKELETHVRQHSETNQKLQDALAQQDQLKAWATALQSEKASADKNMADMRQIFGDLERNVDTLNSELKA
ncbi:hypothetical protein V1525DRAFT_365881 [Lipomyces kononenkoae]|uniref:Uncharacterized protein n=1 Tax=Lipomyces kononenkoae TaxID=34357 RepID=A0ACC3STN1_LIPKO